VVFTEDNFFRASKNDRDEEKTDDDDDKFKNIFRKSI